MLATQPNLKFSIFLQLPLTAARDLANKKLVTDRPWEDIKIDAQIIIGDHSSLSFITILCTTTCAWFRGSDGRGGGGDDSQRQINLQSSCQYRQVWKTLLYPSHGGDYHSPSSSSS